MPISSHEISGIIAGQMQQAEMMTTGMGGQYGPTPLMGASQYPPQFGPPTPVGPMRMSASAMSPMGRFSQGGGFSYSAAGPTIGTYMGATGIGALGMAGSAFSAATDIAGVASMLGFGGTAARVLGAMSPLGMASEGAIAGFGAASGAGLIAGGAGALAGGALLGLPALAAFQSVKYAGRRGMAGFQHQTGLDRFLAENYQFANMGATTGRGFSSNQANMIGSMMRDFESHDPFTSMRDMDSVMQKFTDLGMGQGLKDAGQVGKKIKTMADTVKKMAMIMGKSMEDAAEVFGSMKHAGFFSAADVMGNTQQMMMARGMGMGNEQFLTMQEQAANMARSQQMSGISGARAVAGISQNLMMTGNAQQLMDITGGGNLSESSAILAQRLTGQSAAFLNQSAPGTAILAALGQREGGRFTGQVDQSVLSRLQTGELSLNDISRMGSVATRGRAGGASFMHRQRDITQNLMQQEDFLPTIVGAITREAGEDEDMQALLAERLLGMDRNTFSVVKQQVDDWQRNRRERRTQLQQELAAEAMGAEISRNRSVRGLYTRATGTVADLFSGAEQLGADFATGASNMGMTASDQFWGIKRLNITAAGLENSAIALSTTGIRSPVGQIDAAPTGLAGTIASQRGNAGTSGLVGIARSGGLNQGNMGAMLGISEERQEEIRRISRRAQQSEGLRAQLSSTQRARQGSEGSYDYERMKLGHAITAVAPGLTETEQSFLLSEMGASSIVSEDLTRGAGGLDSGANVFTDVEAAQRSLTERAQENFGTLGFKPNYSNLGKRIVEGVLSGGLSELYLAATGQAFSIMGEFDAGEMQFLVEGGPGANALSAIKGKEKQFLQLKAQAENLPENKKFQFLAEQMNRMTNRTDITIEDAKAAYGAVKDVHSEEGLTAYTNFAAQAELERDAPAKIAAASGAFIEASLSGLEEEQQAVIAQLASGDAGTSFQSGQSVEKLIDAAIEQGNLEQLAQGGGIGASVAMAARGITAAREGKLNTVKAFTERFGISEDALSRIAEGEGIDLAGGLGGARSERLAAAVGREIVAQEAISGTGPAVFSGGMDPEVQLATQVQRTAELLDAVDSKITGRPTVSGAYVNRPVEGTTTSEESSRRPSEFARGP